MRKGITIFVLFLISGFWSPLWSQSTGSPYTSLGIGTVLSDGLVYNQNMGGMGVALNNNWSVNNLNAALLPFNSFFTFEAAVSSESNLVTSDTLSQKNLSGTLDYVIFAFPIKAARSTVSLGLTPYSNVSYNVVTSGPVVGTPTTAEYKYKGSGGINRAFIANGWKVFKGFYAGLKISYLFGTIYNNAFINPADEVEKDTVNGAPILPDYYYTSVHSEKTRYSDFVFEPGIAYIINLTKNTTLNMGATYEITSHVKTYRGEMLEMRRGPERPVTLDTLAFDERFYSNFPSRMAFGVSLNKFLKWSVGLDVHYEKWEDYRNYDNSNDGFKNSLKFILGGFITPDISSVTNYLQRITYQLGIYFEKTPIYLKNQQINEFGMNFGVSLPIRNASLMTLGMNFGKRGTLSDHLIKENYIKFRLGLSFNDRSFGWYRKQRKFN